MRSRLFLTLLTLLAPAAVLAQGPTIEVGDLECLPNEENAVIEASVSPDLGGTTVRLYFRRLNPEGTFYYDHFFARGNGRYWTVFPKPEDRKQIELDDEWWEELQDRDWMAEHDREWLEELLEDREHELAEYYVAVHDGNGERIARSEIRLVEVRDTDDCEDDLDQLERGWSQNLTVGETIQDQYGEQVFHWLCDGIVTRIDWNDVIRADEFCRACVVALLPDWLLPAGGALAGAAVMTQLVEGMDDPPATPSRP